MDERTLTYLQQLPRSTAAVAMLRALGGELAGQVPAPQLRALLYRTGRALAREHSASSIKTLAEFEGFAGRMLASLDLGWMQIEEVSGAVDFLHGAAPLTAWFGTAAAEWSAGLLEGLYAEWMMQLGADERLDVREIEDRALPEGVVRLRFAHESAFGV
ncbi:cellulose biosynthesis protein BcsD [Solimonas terrae]|uniref:Cellulose synthase n=1 Tax=Solimonas terrae TaxID=1396819 RepID=A0A6M2BMT9_9GAMM|nr:cellulose synthase [Solimonas terrae]